MSNTEKPKDKSVVKAPRGKNGGARPGAGRPKGSMNAETKLRVAAKRKFVERVVKVSDTLFNAQYDVAVGEKFLMVVKTIGSGAKQRRETSIVTNPETIIQYLNEELDDTDNEYYFMTTKPADNRALDSLLNRAFGKPEEKLDITSGDKELPVPLLYGLAPKRLEVEDGDAPTDDSTS